MKDMIHTGDTAGITTRLSDYSAVRDVLTTPTAVMTSSPVKTVHMEEVL